MTPSSGSVVGYSIAIRHEDDPNGYAGVRGRVTGEVPRGAPLYLTLADPWGNTWSGMAGDKPEYGPSGFGWLVSHPGDYTLTLKQYLLHQAFPVPIRGGEMTVVELAPLPGPAPDDGAPPPPPAPEPDLAALLDRLDRILALLELHDDRHAAPVLPAP